eukprot:scpid85524/ scgid24291/ U11/U12 small nuclear ribonucleoprotein 35 kDa protein; U1 snRNP-binding protein homolog
MSSSNWTPIAKVYKPLQAGSIDGTDTVPHDRGVLRAMLAKYHPNKQVAGVARRTLFVGRLSPETSEETIRECCEKYGKLVNVRLVKDIVTGASRRYAFVEFDRSSDAGRAQQRLNKSTLDSREIFVDFECERDLPGWIPRRLGGGFGGQKESGQLRFGGLDRPFRKPFNANAPSWRGGRGGGGGGWSGGRRDTAHRHGDYRGSDRDRADGRQGDSGGRHGDSDRHRRQYERESHDRDRSPRSRRRE